MLPHRCQDMMAVLADGSHQGTAAAISRAVPVVSQVQQRPQLLNGAVQSAERVERAVGSERRGQMQGGAPEPQRFRWVQQGGGPATLCLRRRRASAVEGSVRMSHNCSGRQTSVWPK